MSTSPRNTTRPRIIAISLALVIIAAGGFLVFRSRNPQSTQPANSALSLPLTPSPEQTGESEPDQVSNPTDQESDRFTHPDYGFSFELPEDSHTSAFKDDAGDVVLVETKNPKENFQIFIMPFDEAGPMTPARIKKDLPQKLVKNPRNGKLAGVPFLAFESQEPDVGATFEIWLVHADHLYQFRSPLSFQKLLEGILNTWTF